MGRPAKPLAIHRLQGTARMDRHANRIGELEVSGAIGKPPKWLPKEARAEWKRLAEHPQYGKALTELDRDGFMEYCWLHARLVDEIQGRCVIRQKDAPAIVQEGTEGLEPLTSSDSQRLHSLRMQLGLTPASRSKVRLPEKPAKNKFDHLRPVSVSPIAAPSTASAS